jgi:hypothetical protein
MVSASAVFLKKIGSGKHSDPKFGWRAGGVCCIDAKKKRFQNTILACVLLRNNFWNGVMTHSIPKIPLISVI